MVKTGISYSEMSKILEPPISHMGLFYQIQSFCKKTGSKKPIAKSGVKQKNKQFNLTTKNKK